MLTLSNLSPQPGSRKNKKRLGRGHGTGHGKTSGRGHKGQKSRSGSSIPIGFEGGQMPLQRRLPKRGFNNIFKMQFAIINIQDLDCFDDDSTIDRQTLIEAGMIDKKYKLVKLLGNGEISKKLNIAVDKVSAGAKQKIEAAGGSVKE